LLAGKAPGLAGAKALLRAAEIRLDAFGSADGVLEYLARARAVPGLPPELLERVDALEKRTSDPRLTRSAKLLAQQPAGGEAPVEAPAAPEPPVDPLAEWGAVPARDAAPRILACRLAGMSPDGLELVSQTGRRNRVDFARLVAVAAALAPDPAAVPGSPPRHLLFTDLVLSWGEAGQGPSVLRVPNTGLNLQQMYPGMAPREAYATFLENLLNRSGATPLPSQDTLKKGAFPRFDNVKALDAALYGG
jgi:hypothetical protein